MSRTAPKIGTIRVTRVADTRSLLVLFDGPEKGGGGSNGIFDRGISFLGDCYLKSCWASYYQQIPDALLRQHVLAATFRNLDGQYDKNRGRSK
jgi:hypothetical protein